VQDEAGQAQRAGENQGPKRPPAYAFDRSKRERPARPRQVRQGVKLQREREAIAEHWLASRWHSLVDGVVGEAAKTEGLEYAQIGQTRRMSIEGGRVVAAVQGRDTKAYSTTISLSRFTDEQWDTVTRVLAEQAVYAAKLLAGSLPEGIGEALEDAGLSILPRDAGEVTVRCSCREEDKPWCKHAFCVSMLLCDRLIDDPHLIFALRGLEEEQFLERLREQRAIAGGGQKGGTVYSPRIPHVSEMGAPEASLERFWEMDPGLERLELPVTAPEVSHPLLRRLGTSPFAGATFPLVGLLATCYEVVSEAVLREERGGDVVEEEADEGEA